MKRSLAWLAVAAVAVVGILAAGCTPQQVQVAAEQAGVASIVTWIGIDNPTDAQKQEVFRMTGVISSKVEDVANKNISFYLGIYPSVQEYVLKQVSPQSRPVCLLAGGWILTGIDTILAMYPELSGNVEKIGQVAMSFCKGVKVGLSMNKNAPVMKAAYRGAGERARVKSMAK